MNAWRRAHPAAAGHRYEPVHEDHGSVPITRCEVCGLATEIDSDRFERGMPPETMALVLAEVRRWETAGWSEESEHTGAGPSE